MSSNDTELTQQPLVGTPSGEAIDLQTSGRTIRPFLAPVTELVDEVKLRFDTAGVSITAVDPANVAMVETQLSATAIAGYDLDAEAELVVGMNLAGLAADLRTARMGTATDDPVGLTIDESAARMEIERDYDGTTIRQSDQRLTIDADMIREEPDLPELDLPCTATISPRGFEAAVDHIDKRVDHLRMLDYDGHLAFAGAGDDDLDAAYATAAHFEDTAVDGDAGDGSHFSIDYLSDIASGIVAAKADQVRLAFGEELPVTLEYERTTDDGETLYRGRIVQAPRIES